MTEYIDGKITVLLKEGSDVKRVSALLSSYKNEVLFGDIFYSLEVPSRQEDSAITSLQKDFSDILDASGRMKIKTL